VKQIDTKILRWFAANARDLPWRHTLNPYAIWISEIMLQQTQVKTVIPYWERWMREFPDVRSLAAAPLDRVLKMWEGLGYYSRARNAHHAAQHIAEFPRDFDGVLALPGIGRYSAGAICSIAFNHPVPVLDGNVARVLARLFGIRKDPKSSSARKQFWQIAQRLVTEASHRELRPFPNAELKISGPCSALNQGLMELGAVICTPRNPSCKICPLRRPCAAFKSGNPEAYPRKVKRTRTLSRYFLVLVPRQGDHFLVRQRPAGIVNSGFWEFPNFELPSDVAERKSAAGKILKHCPKSIRINKVYKHTIMHYRIHLEVHLISGGGKALMGDVRWFSPDELKKLPFAGTHRKILRDLIA
jgi:A/G-specific adenine glycosylase